VIGSNVPISMSWFILTNLYVNTMFLFTSEMNNYLARKTDMDVNSCFIIL
jgi:hypothetical protein